MLKHAFLSSILLILALMSVQAQFELPEGEFCYSNPTTIYREIGQSGGLVNLDTFRMFITEELSNGWVQVFYEGEIGFVHNPDCMSMEDLHAEADPIIEETLAILENNPQDHEALAEIARASIMIGDYEQGILYIEQAIALEPRNFHYNALLGAAYREIGRESDLMHYLIPDISMQENWCIEGAGTDNIHFAYFEDISIIDHWMILKLMTWTYIAVPEGWILSDDIGNSFIGLDLDISDLDSAEPDIILRVAQDMYRGSIEDMPDYLYGILSNWDEAHFVGSEILDENTGYALISFTENGDSSLDYWLLAFSRALPSDVDGGWRLFLYATQNQKAWLNYYPLMQGIIANARNFEFIPVGVMLPIDFDANNNPFMLK